MKLSNGNGQGAVRCQISPANDVRVENHLDLPLEADTVCYAVCRFFVKTPLWRRLCLGELSAPSGQRQRAEGQMAPVHSARPLLEL